MPDILKGNHFKFSPKDGLVEKDESLDDILNPGESELAMEKMEQGIKRMSNMQKAGVDIFYAGFSQMKRYPFFYKLINWFMPFDIKHPDLGEAILNDENLQSIAKVFTTPTLCSSDKYSSLCRPFHCDPTTRLKSAITTGTFTISFSLRMISVFPHPVGPTIAIFIPVM